MQSRRDIIVVGASLGGIDALRKLTSGLSPGLEAAVLVVLHTHRTGPRILADILGASSSLEVSYAQHGQTIKHGHVYLASPDHHLTVKSPGLCCLTDTPKVHHHRPAADPLFISAAEVYGPRVIGVVLTGGDGDGTKGSCAITSAGGITIIQDPDEAVAPSMPLSAWRGDHPSHVARVEAMPALLECLLNGSA